MNNYTLCTAEADIRPAVQQPYGNRKDVAPCEGVTALDQHEN